MCIRARDSPQEFPNFSIKTNEGEFYEKIKKAKISCRSSF